MAACLRLPSPALMLVRARPLRVCAYHCLAECVCARCVCLPGSRWGSVVSPGVASPSMASPPPLSPVGSPPFTSPIRRIPLEMHLVVPLGDDVEDGTELVAIQDDMDVGLIRWAAAPSVCVCSCMYVPHDGVCARALPGAGTATSCW